MISPSELRLGNCVMVNGSLQKVSNIASTSVFTKDADSNEEPVAEHRMQEIEPVPLSDELLKQCGFVYHNYFKFWQLMHTGNQSEMDVDKDYHVIDFMRKPMLSRLTSLHQLQNVYFILKGKELTLTMPKESSMQLQ